MHTLIILTAVFTALSTAFGALLGNILAKSRIWSGPRAVAGRVVKGIALVAFADIFLLVQVLPLVEDPTFLLMVSTGFAGTFIVTAVTVARNLKLDIEAGLQSAKHAEQYALDYSAWLASSRFAKQHVFEAEVTTNPTAVVLSRAALAAHGIETDCPGPFLLTKDGIAVIDGAEAVEDTSE